MVVFVLVSRLWAANWGGEFCPHFVVGTSGDRPLRGCFRGVRVGFDEPVRREGRGWPKPSLPVVRSTELPFVTPRSCEGADMGVKSFVG